MQNTITVELAYAKPQEQILLEVSVEEGANINDVIEKSKIIESHPEIDLAENKVGIWKQVLPLDAKVKENDRVIIFRPLTIDPKDARMLRVKQKRKEERVSK